MATETHTGLANQEFQRKVKDTRLYSVVSASNFVLVSRLREWLLSDSTIDALPNKKWLEHILLECNPQLKKDPNWKHPFNTLVKKFQTGESCCLRVFCILADLGICHHVFALTQSGLKDAKLPLLDAGSFFEGIKEIKNPTQWSRLFQDKQWQYCAEIVRSDGPYFRQEQQIIPITYKMPINELDDDKLLEEMGNDSDALHRVKKQSVQKGGVGTVFRIRIPDEYVAKEIQKNVCDSKQRKDKMGVIFFEFAMKEVPEKDFERETRSFQTFGLENPNPGMVLYIDNYSQQKSNAVGDSTVSRCIILECCDGDLDDWMKTEQPPLLPSDIHTFWFGLFQVALGLEKLHITDQDGSRWRGWHFDIKPDNILRVGTKWKLGDPGFAKYREVDGSNRLPSAPEVAMTSWEQGTKTCGAPETHLNRSNKPVSQNVDIWSLGCIFSMAATWVVVGIEGVRIFRERRTNAINHLISRFEKENPGKKVLESGDQFHDSKSVLPAVSEWHQLLRETARKPDHLTAKVLDLVDKNMLIESPGGRHTASQICAALEVIQKDTPLPGTKITKDFANEVKKLFHHSNSRAITDLSGGLETLPKATTATLPTDTTNSHGRQAGKNEKMPETKDTSDEQDKSDSTRHPVPTPGNIKRRDTLALTSAEITKLKYTTIHDIVREQRMGPTNHGFKRFKAFINRSRPDHPFAKHIANRNFKILVDDSSNMKSHWANATTVVGGIASQLLDFENLSLEFFYGERKLAKGKNERFFKEYMQKETPVEEERLSVATNVAGKFKNMFSVYQQAVKKNEKWTQNGTQADEVWDEIVNCVKGRRRLEKEAPFTLGNRPFSIQFVLFGNEQDIKNWLDKYDDEIKDVEGCDGEDLVDWEPWDRRFYKTILGSTSPLFDEPLLELPRSQTDAPHSEPRMEFGRPSTGGPSTSTWAV